MGCPCAFCPQEGWRGMVLRWLWSSKQANRSLLLAHSPPWRSDWQDSRFSNLFYTRSLVCVPAGQNPPTWYSQQCLWHSRLWWTDSWNTYTSFLFTSTTFGSSARTKNNSLNTFEKCWQSWDFLGYIVSYDIVQSSTEKQLVSRMASPMKTLQSFLGFVKFYRGFIPGFTPTATSLTKLLIKNAAFNWKPEWQNGFDQLRQCLLRGPVLNPHDPSLSNEWGVTLLATPLVVCWIKNVLMAGTQ